jgi:predicted nuclease with TOPRIM domain
MMTVQTLGLILATLMTIVAAVGWSRCRKLAFDLKQVKHDLDLTINEKENLIKAQTGTKAQGGASERTVLALAGEISRIENNLTYMDDVPGRKQLHKCIERMKTYLQTENYDIVPLIGSKYNEGMMASAVFVHDERIPKGEAKIISVQLPQVNYCGKMIQSAKITVGENIE